jgi:hypothetical protein
MMSYVVYCGTGCVLNVREIMPNRYCSIFHPVFVGYTACATGRAVCDVSKDRRTQSADGRTPILRILVTLQRKIPEKSCRNVRLVFRIEANVQIQYSCFWARIVQGLRGTF